MAELDTTVTEEMAISCPRGATVMTWDGLVDREKWQFLDTIPVATVVSSNLIAVALCYLMSRKRQKPLKAGIDQLYRKCCYCKAHQSAHFFHQHQAACKTQWIIRNEDRQQHFHATSPRTLESQDQAQLDRDEFVEGSSMMELDDDSTVAANSSTAPQIACVEEPNPSE